MDELEVTIEKVCDFTYYNVGDWSFDEEDKELAYIDKAIEAWTVWRKYVAAEIASADLA